MRAVVVFVIQSSRERAQLLQLLFSTQTLVVEATYSTDLRADVELWSETQQLVDVVELTEPWEEA